MSYARDLQNTFLNCVRSNHHPVTVFLVNGVKLQGTITWFDNYCLLLKRDNVSQLVYKHAISTIMPSQPIQLRDLDEEEKPTGDASAEGGLDETGKDD